MPLYRCTSVPDALDDDQRATLANAITEIHCELTGAPDTYVHVQFFDARGDEATPFVLHGGIRAGRTPELEQELVRRCIDRTATIAGVEAGDVSMRTSSTQASWIFEGGGVFPEPGQEHLEPTP